MEAPESLSAAVITVGTEIVDGIGLDTNTREIAAALTRAGYRVVEAVSVPDEMVRLSATIARLVADHGLVVCTGGLGPTHDDITRQAAATALGIELAEDPGLRSRLEGIAGRHTDPRAAQQVYRQAQVLHGASVLPATSGTAPGQVVSTPRGRLVLLPGPPHEMRGMLRVVLETDDSPRTRILGCVGVSESDAQIRAQDVLADYPDLELTVLATPGNVRIVVSDRTGTGDTLEAAADAIAARLDDACYTTTGQTLPEAVIGRAIQSELSLAVAESCTGGSVGAALTSVPGSSAVFVGGIIAYDNRIKDELLGVERELLTTLGAVSPECAAQMAVGARERLGADLAVSVTGIAGPDGGTDDKPVGLVWFGLADAHGVIAVRRDLFGDRDGIRERATVTALDLLRRRLAGKEVE